MSVNRIVKRRILIFSAAFICISMGLLIYWLTFSNRERSKQREMESTKDTAYLKAVHYFADEWPINFWNSEWDTLEEDLDQIKGDGFNTVIFVVPWREFQPDIQEITYNNVALERLDFLLTATDKAGLWAKIRLGYLNDYYGEGDVAERFYDIVGDKATQRAWFDYVETVYSICIKHECFKGGFITWEDFWHNYALVDYVGGTELGIEMASDAGFQDYINDTYGIGQFNSIFQQNFESCKEIYVPNKDCLYAGEWYSYIDHFTLDLLKASRKYFPGLSMEVRTDKDLIATPDGTLVDHSVTWDCAGGRYTAIMYKPNQGTVNDGSKMSSSEAIEYLDQWLKNILANNAQTPIFMEQFLFTDNTPGFEGGTEIKEDQLEEYLTNVDKVLYENTMGYGIWVYKDYKTNMLYNPQFALGLDGWCGDKVDVEEINNSMKAHLYPDSSLSQSIPSIRRFSDKGSSVLEMDIINLNEQETFLIVEIGDQTYEINVNENGKYSINLSEQAFGDLKIYSQGEVYIDNLKYYMHYQKGRIYNSDGEEDLCIEALRELNRKLSERDASS